jgi:DNA-binding transcriptional MerR regulator
MNDSPAPELLLAAARGPAHPSEPGAGEPMYTIGELAKQFDLSLRALRFYESQGLLEPVRRGRKRLYGPKDVERLAFIVKAKKLGLTLSAIQQIIAGAGAGQSFQLSREACLAQIAALERKLVEIEGALAELRGLLDDRRSDER